MSKIYEQASAANTGRQANYRQIESHLIQRTPFSGSSMSAFYDRDGDYVVVSYSTVIATVSNGEIEIAENRWGPTTGRHINLCTRCL